jgi:hypothetical protein
VLVFEVEPSKVFVFGKGTFSQTRHRYSSNPAIGASSLR